MKAQSLLVIVALSLLCSCSTAYRASQTPDDVYYSPARPQTAKVERKQDKQQDYYTQQDDSYLRMKVSNRDRWSTIDDYDYWYDSRYRPYYTYNHYRNSYSWNNWYPGYNPYNRFGYGYRNFNYYGYNNGYYPKGGYGSGYSGNFITKNPYPQASNVNRPSLRGYSNSNNGNSFGNTVKRVFSTPANSGNGNSSYNNSNTRTTTTSESPVRTYNPPASSSSSSSGSSSSGGGVSRPARSGN